MNLTWITDFPNGWEEGRVLTIDMGGTNLRVCDVYLPAGRRDFEQTQRKYKLPEEVKTGTGEQLWDWIADRLKGFIEDKHIEASESEKLPLAITFSFPVYQKHIRSGVLQRWTKNFNVAGVEGHDVVPQLEAALEKKVSIIKSRLILTYRRNGSFVQKVPVRLVALVNDTTGTLLASRYRDPHIQVGSIFSTGCNAAYMETCQNIPKLGEGGLAEGATVVINTEYGAFDNDRQVLPLTPYDLQIDRESTRPGTQIYEKMVAGLYIGEMLRLVLVTLFEEGKLFKGQDISRLRRENAVDATFLSIAEIDVSEGLHDTRYEFEENFGLTPSLEDLKICRYLISLVSKRAARLYACGIAAICKKNNVMKCHVGVDGAVFNKYSGFKSRAAQALREILDWPAEELDLIALNPSEDGSGVGAALAAALSLGCDVKEKSSKIACIV